MQDILSDVLDSAVLPPPRGGGSALFVINLCASMAPIAVAGKTLPGLESYRLYQVARVEDGRPRHRLRLGFFNNESDAEAVLESVRARYPTAFTTCLSDDDRKFARGFLPPALQDASDTAIVRTIHAVVDGLPPAKIAESAARKAPVAAPRAVPQAVAPKPVAKPAAQESVVTEISWSPPALTPVKVVSVDKRTNKASAPAPAATNNSAVAPSTAKLPAAKIVAARAPIAVKPIAAPKLPSAPRAAAAASAKNAAPAAPKLAPKAAAPAAAPAPAKPAPAKPIPAAAARTPAPSTALTLETPKAAAAPAPAAPASNTAPFRVDRGIQIPQTGLSLAAEAAAPKPAQRPAAASAPKAPAPIAKPAQPPIAAKAAPQAKAPVAPAKPAPAAKAAPHAPAPAKPAAAKPSIADLDSTQTIRALTAAELNDANQPKWFVVQLAISEQAINLDTMPHLDIFAAYRLYSVATAGSGKILHSLRLGFFKEEVSAQAVTGYLKTFFASPSVVRIAASEQLRFAEPMMGVKPTGAALDKEDHKVIELSEVRDRIGKALEVVPTLMAVEPPKKPVTKTAQKSAGTATKRAPIAPAKSSAKANMTGKHRTLGEELMDEARQVILSESAIRKLPKNDSLLSKLVDKLKK